MPTSNTFLFQSPQSVEIITDAYERITGDYAPKIVQEKINSAQRSLNFILSSWPNRGLNLWTVKSGLLALFQSQNTYYLPPMATDVLSAAIRTSTRNLGGVASSSAGGVAQNAFDGNPATVCTQTAANGNIGYSWNQTRYAISMVGIQSNQSLTYTLVFEYSFDGAEWITVSSQIPSHYTKGVLNWTAIDVPVSANQFRIRETGGITLDIQELYFNTAMQDIPLGRNSTSEYFNFANKTQSGRPTSFAVDRQINPVIIIWQTPDLQASQINTLFYRYIAMPQDIGAMTNAPAVPSRFLEALTSALAYKLGLKENVPLDKLQSLKDDAMIEFKYAFGEDVERVPLRISADLGANRV